MRIEAENTIGSLAMCHGLRDQIRVIYASKNPAGRPIILLDYVGYGERKGEI